MKDCSNHKKDVAGISDMKELATLIGDLHYETLGDFLHCLSNKLKIDSDKDLANGRKTIKNKYS
ncbi:MAG TPA: hypothetical protein VN703_09845 [Candidatus Sulfopaludibacter sp.]|nr:hypothetical protein [Candidatus Sulfopaludibacter sp.]